jgi:hypothetical protein
LKSLNFKTRPGVLKSSNGRSIRLDKAEELEVLWLVQPTLAAQGHPVRSHLNPVKLKMQWARFGFRLCFQPAIAALEGSLSGSKIAFGWSFTVSECLAKAGEAED